MEVRVFIAKETNRINGMNNGKGQLIFKDHKAWEKSSYVCEEIDIETC